MNPYFENAKCLLKLAEKNIKDTMTFDEMIIPSLFFAIGIESLLKGIIYDINPTFIYKEPVFNNILPVLYKEKIKFKHTEKNLSDDKESDKLKKLNSKPNSDVLNFRESLHRAEYLSVVTHNHKATLNRLRNVRDIISHCLLKELEENNLKDILSQFKFLIFKYEKELDFKLIEAVVDIKELEKQKLEIQTRVQEKLESHKKIWDTNKSNDSYVSDARANTIININPLEADEGIIIECPACKQRSVLSVYWELGMNDYAETIVENILVRDLFCFFCKLSINKPEEIDFLKLNEAKRIQINWTSDGENI